MTDIRITAVSEPLAAPHIARKAIGTIGRAASMGLLPEDEVVETLDLDVLQEVGRHIGAAGIAPAALTELLAWKPGDPERLDAILDELDRALFDSPVPDCEWREVVRVLGEDRVASLVSVSGSSLRRYASGERETPDLVAARLHHLALMVGNLAGSYNHYGVRRWFERKRVRLNDRTPSGVLRDDWSPDEPDPRKVLALSESLVGSPAT